MLKRILREPLVHFLLIGIGLFVVFGVMNETEEQEGQDIIVVSSDDIERLRQGFEAVWRRQPLVS